MEIVKVTKDNFDEEVLKSSKKVLIDFNADWCGPCRMLAPILEEIAKEHDEIKIVSINIDEEEELAEDYQVFSIPCLVLMEEGEEKNRSVGLKPKDAIMELIGD